MKKIFLSLFISTLCYSFVKTSGQTTRMLKKNIELQMPGEDGANGGSVAWHPVQKKYYAAMAGNTSYPLAVFDASGKKLSPDELTTFIDVRGLWYNPETKKICGNGFNDNGWFSYLLNEKGIPEDITKMLVGKNQPGEQSVGTYNTKNKLLYFISGKSVLAYDMNGNPVDDSTIQLSISIDPDFEGDEDEYMDDNYNTTTVVYTGILKNEFGLLNYNITQIELYNKNTGALSQILKLPEGTLAYNWLNFSFANGIYWLFDKDSRKWIGYK